MTGRRAERRAVPPGQRTTVKEDIMEDEEAWRSRTRQNHGRSSRHPVQSRVTCGGRRRTEGLPLRLSGARLSMTGAFEIQSH